MLFHCDPKSKRLLGSRERLSACDRQSQGALPDPNKYLFYHLTGERVYCQRHLQAEYLGRLAIYDELECSAAKTGKSAGKAPLRTFPV